MDKNKMKKMLDKDPKLKEKFVDELVTKATDEEKQTILDKASVKYKDHPRYEELIESIRNKLFGK